MMRCRLLCMPSLSAAPGRRPQRRRLMPHPWLSRWTRLEADWAKAAPSLMRVPLLERCGCSWMV